MKLLRFISIGFVLFLFSFQSAKPFNLSYHNNNNDSIKILLREHYMVDTIKVERTVFLDYKRHSKYKEKYYKADSLYLKLFWVSNIFKSKNEHFTVNLNKTLLGTYISISKLKGAYIFFSQGMDDIMYSLAYVKDSTITFLHMEGWFVYYYNKIEQLNHKIIIETKYNSEVGNSLRIGIKIIDKVHNIQIWKITSIKSNGNTSTHYELKAPLNFALSLPILVINNDIGLDTMYKGIDKLDLKEIYNE
ncbi:hypothetical protein LA303_07920 [Candidatus Sulfidibacterium hydrothermale]|uniref:hypothetical protein n=1 Tax=Candidatus Sulfidibacterium hydrothermale TaxID=2875962 RepID=UPI001F0B4058|nr:hypothetical protein [Candidatus Sulfidibacterium hydrothermale]UBM61350.1 hypothetical protein LA303_07920 [Candidatus Sulfidibacterium hydrothermale]